MGRWSAREGAHCWAKGEAHWLAAEAALGPLAEAVGARQVPGHAQGAQEGPHGPCAPGEDC